jgi:PAS domain S-box-containing protein
MQESKQSIEITGLEGVNRQDHLCLIYEVETEILTPVIPFIQKGVAQGERCIYLNGGEETLERVLKNAVSGQKHDTGALILLPAQETWLKDGSFEVSRVTQLLQTLTCGAIADGFKGSRIICDMAWVGQQEKWVELLHDFEQGLKCFSAQNEVTLLCLYNRQAIPPDRLLEIAKSHSHLLLGGKVCPNPFFIPVHPGRSGKTELDLYLNAVHDASATAAEREKLRQELEQAYAALARKIYENWQEEDTLRASEKELHEKDEALLAHKRRLQTILQHIPAILMAFDTSDCLAACNHEFERVTGYRAEEVMGKQILELIQVDGEMQDEVVASHPSEGGDYRGREWHIRCKDGSVKSVSWSNISKYVPIPGWTNWVIGLDVTPRVHAELGLRSLTDELDARNGDLEAFGFAVSHDLSGQLSKISGHCAVMEERYGVALSPQCREMLRSIQEVTLDMVARITALQRFTTLAAGGLQQEKVDLSAIASEIAAQLAERGARRSVTFQIEDGVTATGDRKLLRLAMEQLLVNAWNYTLGVQHPVIQFGTAQVEGERSYFISDNGPRFDHLESCLSPRSFGKADRLCCGIGLATVQRIITLHRGRIWAADDAGKGGTLYFRV